MAIDAIARRVRVGLGREEGVQVPIAIQLLSMANFRWLWLSNGLALMSFQIRNMGQAWITLDLTTRRKCCRRC